MFDDPETSHFEFVVSDWGAAGEDEKHFGGSPIYGSSLNLRSSRLKDFFAFGRIALELFLPQSGMLVKISLI